MGCKYVLQVLSLFRGEHGSFPIGNTANDGAREIVEQGFYTGTRWKATLAIDRISKIEMQDGMKNMKC
jgi:hypothetical protein